MGMSNYEELETKTINMVREGKWEEVFEDLKNRESNGEKDAVAVLAQLYLHGVGVAKDVDYGVELLNKAIVMESSDAAYTLGMLYYQNEIGFPMNNHKAFELFEKGAESGNEKCYGGLSDCYLRGNGTQEDEDKAFKYAMMAAKAGNPIGMVNAAICYEDGIGTNQDPYAACHWYKEYLNIEPEDDNAMLRIALCLADPYGRFGIHVSGEMLNEAFYYAGKAVEKGNVEAHLIVGWFYEKGDVVPQDFNMAHKYIQIAADNGDETAQQHIRDFRKSVYGTYYIPGL